MLRARCLEQGAPEFAGGLAGTSARYGVSPAGRSWCLHTTAEAEHEVEPTGPPEPAVSEETALFVQEPNSL